VIIVHRAVSERLVEHRWIRRHASQRIVPDVPLAIAIV
jgi:hypothetical protein